MLRALVEGFSDHLERQPGQDTLERGAMGVITARKEGQNEEEKIFLAVLEIEPRASTMSYIPSSFILKEGLAKLPMVGLNFAVLQP